MSVPPEAVQAAEAALIAHSVEERMPGICRHQGRTAVEAAAPILTQAAYDEVIRRIQLGISLMTDRKSIAGAAWVQSQIEDVLMPRIIPESHS